MNITIEVIGIVSTVLILISMLFKTTSIKGSILMRSLNIAGSAAFVMYGCLLPAISTAILNGALIIVNLVHLISLLRQGKKSKTTCDKNK